MAPQNPVKHVVLIVKENHTFDNYFGTFPGANGDATLAHSPNPPNVSPSNNHRAWLNRAADAVRQQYLESDIPAYFDYARQFTLADNYFTEIASDSTPNHLMLIAADSPVINNIPSGSSETFSIPSLPASLEAAGLSLGNYGGYAFTYIKGLAGKFNYPSSQFAKDAAAGKLPVVSWVYAPGGLSEHPKDNVTQGMQWTVDQVNAVVAGGLWPQTAIFITWDDWGGYYDHVTPPEAEKWSDGTQFRYGSRTGCLVLSPYARSGHISSVLCSHVSLLKFCEETFGVPPLNARDGDANGMSDCFDFTQKPALPPASARPVKPPPRPKPGRPPKHARKPKQGQHGPRARKSKPGRKARVMKKPKRKPRTINPKPKGKPR